MSFRINTNIAAMNAYANSLSNDAALSGSLNKLSSGLQIQNAADDASGMTIADSLRSQANALGQAIKNANDAVGIVQTADVAMNEQIKILDTIKTKATQAAQDGQSEQSRSALQADISRLLEELDNIANTTSFNGQTLLNGNFSNKNFQIGAYSNETVKVNIGATNSNKIGLTRFETSAAVAYKISATYGSKTGLSKMDTTVRIKGLDNFPKGFQLEKISGAEMSREGFKAIADRLNAVSDQTGVKATVHNNITFSAAVTAGSIKGLEINGAKIGNLEIQQGDANAALVNAINAVTDQTGVKASTKNGKLTLASTDGRAINIIASANAEKMLGMGDAIATNNGTSYFGKLSLVRQDARDIMLSISTAAAGTAKKAEGKFAAGVTISKSVLTGGTAGAASSVAQKSVNLKTMNTGILSSAIAEAMGYFNAGDEKLDQRSGVTTYAGAQAMIDVAESAQKLLDRVRSDLGSAQNQLKVTITNITSTQVNVKSAESQIRDVDFANEASNFNKFNILAQSGSYAMSQANTVQQNVLKLLQ